MYAAKPACSTSFLEPFAGIFTEVMLCIWLYSLLRAKVMLLGAVLLGRSLEARQRLKAAESLQGLFDVRPDQVCKRGRGVRQKASGPSR